MQDMDDATLVFERLRPRLHGIAYRMLGSAAEAEKVMQDAWLRWQEAAEATLERAEARLVFITTRLCLERLRQLMQERGEPLLTGSPATPEQMLERADDIVVAFLALLERLAPEARAAFLLREMFDADYDDLSRTIGKGEAASRQMVHRAKEQLRDERPHYAGSPDIHYATVLEGEIRSQVNDGPVTTYKAGQSFSELPGDRHGISANASETKPANLLAVFVVDTNETGLTISFGE